jgi:GT2 family glycosyltransferase
LEKALTNPPDCPLVTVVLLSHDRPLYLEHALNSILLQNYPRLEIIVVDNPSVASPSIREIIAKHPRVRLVSMKHNSGYTGGMNEGIRVARGQYLYLTEDDMVSDPDAIGTMVEYMEQDKQSAIVSGALYNDTGSLICAGGFVKLGRIYSQFLIGRDTPIAPELHGPFCVSYATGAMMLLRRSALEDMGAFRSDFFMYFEDVEICARMIAAGRTVVIAPRAKATTLGDKCSNTTSKIEFHKMKNFLAVNLLHAPVATLPEFLLRYAGLTLIRELIKNKRRAALLLCADVWVATRVPWLVLQRWRREIPHFLRQTPGTVR